MSAVRTLRGCELGGMGLGTVICLRFPCAGLRVPVAGFRIWTDVSGFPVGRSKTGSVGIADIRHRNGIGITSGRMLSGFGCAVRVD